MRHRHKPQAQIARERRLQVEAVVLRSVRDMTPEQFEMYFEGCYRCSRAAFHAYAAAGGKSVGELAVDHAAADRHFVLELPCRGRRLKDWLTAEQRAAAAWRYRVPGWATEGDLAAKQSAARTALDASIAEGPYQLLLETIRDTLQLTGAAMAEARRPETFEDKLAVIVGFIELVDHSRNCEQSTGCAKVVDLRKAAV